MAKLSECLKGTLPADFVSARIWDMVDPLHGREIKKHGRIVPRRESRAEIFRAGQGQRMRKRVSANCTPSTGSIVTSVRLGAYTTCVCKHKV